MRCFVRLAVFVVALVGAEAVRADNPRWVGKPPASSPSRVVTLAPSITEIVIALGAREKLVGVSRYDEAPEVRQLPRVGGFLDPAPEAVLALRPGAVLVQPSPSNQRAVEELARLGIPSLVLPLHSIEEILASVRAIGFALGLEDRGTAIAAKIERDVAVVSEKTAALPKVRVLVVHGFEPLIVAGKGSFADTVLTAAGGENIASDARGPFPVFSAEAVLVAAPAFVIDATGLERKAGEKGFPGLDATIVRLESNGLLYPGPRVADAVLELARMFHPEAFVEIPSNSP